MKQRKAIYFSDEQLQTILDALDDYVLTSLCDDDDVDHIIEIEAKIYSEKNRRGIDG